MKCILALVSLVFLLSGCLKNGPRLTVCISDPDNGGFQCADRETGDGFFIPYEETEFYIAHPPEDYRTLIEFCELKGEQDD